MAYLGNSPGVASQRVVTTFTATAGQTVFTPQSGYTLGYCDVFLNGIKLVNGDDYTASNGTSITLASGAAVGDSVECVAYFPRGLSDGYLKAEADAKYVAKAGDTMTGQLAVSLTNGTVPAKFQGSGTSAQVMLGRTVDAYTGSGYIGADSLYAFRSYNGALTNNGLNIDHSGRVTMPYQPVFAAYYNSTTNATDGYLIPASALVNTGNCYNTTTGRFTAPVAGSYRFAASTLVNMAASASAYGYMQFFINGSATGPIFHSSIGFTRNYEQINGTIALNLALGDSVGVYLAVAGGALSYGGPYLSFNGALLG